MQNEINLTKNFRETDFTEKTMVEIYRVSILPRVEAVGGRLPAARSRLTRFGDILLFLAHCSNSALLNSSKVSLRFRLFL